MTPAIVGRLIRYAWLRRNARELLLRHERVLREEVDAIPMTDEIIAWTAVTLAETIEMTDARVVAQMLRRRIQREGERAHGNTLRP